MGIAPVVCTELTVPVIEKAHLRGAAVQRSTFFFWSSTMSRFLRREPTTREEIQDEIEHLISALADLKKGTVRDSRRNLDTLKSSFEHLLEEGRDLWSHAYPELYGKGRKAGKAAKECVREHPLSTALIGLGAFALVGWLIAKR
jgi:ElaB/YqjD/DUF883 family membrane-anchored ribosome-binding protein